MNTTGSQLRRGVAVLAATGMSAGALAAIQPTAASGAPAPTGSAQVATRAATSITYGCTKSVQAFKVPDGVVRVYAVAWGAAGRGDSAGDGGKGGRASGAIPVKPGAGLTVNVGCMGPRDGEGGWNGGGSGRTAPGRVGQPGGGATDLRTASDLASRLIVAGGGGGKGGNGLDVWLGGAGGAGSQSGEHGSTGQAHSSGPNTPGAGGAGGARNDDSGGDGGRASGNTPNAGGIGGGGGGGWRGGAGGGGARANTNDSGGAGGGGGGGGSSHVDPSATNISYETGASFSDGILSLNWIDITTTALPGGIYGQPFSAQLSAAGGSGPYTWELTGGFLAGLTLNPNGSITGTPTTTAANEVTFRVTDANGAQSVLNTNLVIMPGDTRVTDEPATAIRKRSATANGTVYGRGLPVTNVYCRMATSEAGVDKGTIVNASPGAIGAFDTTSVTCPLDKLRPATRYWYNVIAVDAAGIHQAPLAIQFDTDPLTEQTARLRGVPQVIKKSGVTTLLKKRTRTSDGKTVEVKVRKLKNRKGKKTRGRYTLIRKRNGQVQIRTYGKIMDIQVIYSAPGDADAAPYEVSHTYRVGRKH